MVTGADSVTVTIEGDTSASTTVNNRGTYSFKVNALGTYKVHARTEDPVNIEFTPNIANFEKIEANQIQNFEAVDAIIKTIDHLGEPDEVQHGGFGINAYVSYFYVNKDVNRVYQYRKHETSDGNNVTWYLTGVYLADRDFHCDLYVSPKIVHTPLTTVTSGNQVTIYASITDDTSVKSAFLYYRLEGDTTYREVSMTSENPPMYSAIIPSEVITSKNIEYYLEARDTNNHKSRLPKLSVQKNYTILVSP